MGELRGLGDLLDHLVEWLPEGLVVVDENGAIVFANPRAETMFGYAPGSLEGLRVEALVPEGHRSHHTAHRVGFIAHPHARPMTANLNLQGRRLDGSTFPLDIFLGPTRTQEGVFVLAVVRDVTHRWLLERELRGDLAQVRKLAETVPEVLWVTSPGGDVVHYVNPAYEKVWGQPRERLYDDPFAWLAGVHEDDREAATEALADWRDEARATPFRVCRPDGETRWLEARAVPVEGEDGRLDRVARIIEDVTERKRLEELLSRARERIEAEVQERTTALRLDNERLRSEAAEQVRLGHWLWDIFESLPDGTAVVNPSGDIVGVNKTLCEILGYERGELLGRGIDLLIPSLHRGAHHRHVADFFHRPRRRPMASGVDLEAVRKDGRTVAVDVALSPLQTGSGSFVVASVRDISERRRDDHVSRENRERLELALRGCDAALWDWDLRTGKIYFSPRWKSLLGYEDHEVPNDFDEWRSRLHPADQERAMSSVSAHLNADDPRYELLYRLRHRDGTYRWMLTRGMTLHDAGGRQVRMIGANLDVTECRRYVPAALDRSFTTSFQRSIAPARPPEVPGLLADGRLFPTDPGAGDFFDFLTLADGSFAAVLADVSGRGAASALTAATCHTCLHSLAEFLDDPAAVVTRLNRRLVDSTPAECYATLVLARVDPAFRSLHCVNAGHSPVFVLDASGAVKARVESQGPPLGVVPDAPAPPGQVVGLDAGDTVLLASDGLLGARGQSGAAFGADGLIGAVRAHLHAPPGVLIEVIHQAALRHAGPEEFPSHDDSAVVVLRAV